MKGILLKIVLYLSILRMSESFLFSRQKILRIVVNSNIGSDCSSDLKHVIEDFLQLKPWALKMVDANGKIPSGLTDSNLRLYGNSEQCLSKKENEIQRQYCIVQLNIDPNSTKEVMKLGQMYFPKVIKSERAFERLRDFLHIYYGICAPASCSQSDFQQLWFQVSKEFKIPFLTTDFAHNPCHFPGKPRYFSTADIAIWIFFLTILLLIVCSTVYEIFLKFRNEQDNIYVSFSIIYNTKKLFNTRVESDNLTSMNGIRTLSIFWIFIGHSFVTEDLTPARNGMTFLTEFKENFKNTGLHSAIYAVDTFFALSGILSIYVNLNQSDKQKITIFQFYLFRIMRLTPPLLATVLFYLGVLKYFTNGATWEIVTKKFSTGCINHFWATILFFSNFLQSNQTCLTQSWYLSMDTQYYLLVPLIVFYLKKNTAIAMYGILIFSLISVTYTAIIVSIKELGFLTPWEVDEEHKLYVYQNPLSRIPAWLIGVIFGYVLQKKIFANFSKRSAMFFWCVSIGIFMFLTSYTNVILSHKYNVIQSTLFNCFARPLWSLAVCLVILNCNAGYGGLINEFLSHPIFIVLGKLTYAMYLIHVSGIYIFIENRNDIVYLDDLQLFYDACGGFYVLIFSSVALTLVFESPVVSILSFIKKKRKVEYTNIKVPISV